MGLTKQQKEAVARLDGRGLSAEVERALFGRAPCELPCRSDIVTAEGLCGRCGGWRCAQWAESEIASKYLRGHILNWTAYYRDRFLDHLGQNISARIAATQGGGGAIQPRLWVLYATPEDICRAAILAKMEP